jgi:hypothetical protein
MKADPEMGKAPDPQARRHHIPSSSNQHDTRTDRDKQTPFLFRWRRAIANSDLSRELRATARALSDYMDMDGGGAYPSQRRLAHDVGVHFQTVKRHLSETARQGLVRHRSRRPRTRTVEPLPSDHPGRRERGCSLFG